jgi:hypothetical protein
MSKVNLQQKVPERACLGGIINEYLEYAEGQESPADYHLWSIIAAIGSILGRNVWVDRFYNKIYPNLYVVLVGESALVHKSTALAMAVRPFRRAAPDAHVVTQKITPARLASLLAEIYEKSSNGTSELLIHASELSVLLGQAKLDDSLLKSLTDYWDCPDIIDHNTIARGAENGRNVFVSLMGGTTGDWLRNSLPMDSAEGGFLSRLILVHRPPSGICTPHPEDAASFQKAQMLENVINDLRYLRENLVGEYTWEPAAKHMFSNWYTNHNPQAITKAQSFMRGYYGRKGDMIIKLAIISAASKSDVKVMTREDVYFGISILNENELHTEGILEQLGTTDEGRKYADVLKKIKISTTKVDRGGKLTTVAGVDHSSLMRMVGHKYNGRELSEVISSLYGAKEIMVEYGAKGGKKYIVNTGEKDD